MTSQAGESLQLMRAALENPHGTPEERRQRLLTAWSFLRRSVALGNGASEGSKQLKDEKVDPGKVKKRKREAQRGHRHGQVAKQDEKEKLFLEAAQLGDVEQIGGLLKLGVHISCKDGLGYSALHWSSLYGHIHVVRALLGAGAGAGNRINRKTNSGNTPLHFACTGQHGEVAALLQLYKPDIYAVNEYGQTPISLGLRKLVGTVEEEQRLAQVQALRNQSRLTLMLQESNFEQRLLESERPDLSRTTEIWQQWEAYQISWSKFVQKYGQRESIVSSSINDWGLEAIEFDDVPWPLTARKESEDGEELLLSVLHVSGNDLHSLIQQERLRWHPDKFLQTFDSRLSQLHRDAIFLGVKTVSQLLNTLASDRRATTLS